MFHRPGKPLFGKDSPNKYYESDIRHTLQMCQWLLKPIGMWLPMYGCASINEKIISSILIIVCFCFLCFVLFPASYYIFYREKEVATKLKMVGPVAFCLISTVKYIYLGLRAAMFGRCIRHVENDWRMVDDPEHRNLMLRNVAIGRQITTICVLFLYTGGMSYHAVLPWLSKKTVGNVTSRTLMYQGYDLFFDVTVSPIYEIIFCLHCLYAFIPFNITTAVCSLAAIFVTHACGQIQIQIHRLESLVQLYTTQSTDWEDPLTVIVKDHVTVLRFSGYVEEVLREICLVELATSTFLMCLLEYCCMKEWTNNDMVAVSTYFVLLVAFTFNVLIFCYIGELLVDQGGKIGEACYGIEWYNLPSKKARPLIILILMTKYPPKLTAGRVCDLSLTAFTSVIKSSVAYLNLIRTVSE